MKAKKTIKNPAASGQICILVEGCIVKINFPAESEESVISDIKRMMLGNVYKKA
ncbi:MAG: hypothetical protein LBB91_06415 [Clostridiales bacterium]|nr:hypothetical protein [Clostridiales bacterium]